MITSEKVKMNDTKTIKQHFFVCLFVLLSLAVHFHFTLVTCVCVCVYVKMFETSILKILTCYHANLRLVIVI